MRARKHVYCEKPLTHNIWEAREVARVAKETGVATQMGNIGHSEEGMRQTCEWIWAGAIGAVREVHAWVSATRWNKALTGKPSDTPPVPAGLNWDLWLGPRENRPFHPAYFPVQWRDFWAFGGGGMGDFVCHDLDAACWALDLRDPVLIEARPGGQMNAEIAPHADYNLNTYARWQEGESWGVKEMDVEELRRSGMEKVMTPDEAIPHLRGLFAQAPVDSFFMKMPTGMPFDRFAPYVELFASKVLPAFR